MPIENIRKNLQQLKNPEKARILQRFFKTGPGEYGEGDVFWGITVPELRKLAKVHQDIPEETLTRLLRSPVHEKRMLALLILIRKFENSGKPEQKSIYALYLENIRFVNNWDLVDGSSGRIVGAYLMEKNKAPLYRMATSKNLWERRISIISTFYFIKHDRFSESLKISKMLLADREDLIHKAVGWMLREIGKRDLPVLESFLKAHYHNMPRTMLRYAIEKFPEPQRQKYLKGTIQ
ncbi:MAG: DNA alkylation repair protein [Proteobacteria bacterium]|nr:DNA alkylation repair protein [Pseudomonadota bacterium]